MRRMNLDIFFVLFLFGILILLVDGAEVKIGFVFMFFKQKGFSVIQQPEVWEKFFASAKNRAVVAFVNYQSSNIPKFVDAYFTKTKALNPNGIGYIHTYLKVSKYLIDEYEATGVILLSGGVVPTRCFDNIYTRISPYLSKGASVLPEYISTDPVHVSRYYQVAKAAVTVDAWGVHPSAGYCLHQNLITLALNTWEQNSKELRNVERFDEHYLSYIIRGALNPDSGHSRLSLRIYQELDKRSLMYVEWGKNNSDGSLPYIWKTQLTEKEIEVLRQNDYYFLKEVSKTCDANIEVLLKCG